MSLAELKLDVKSKNYKNVYLFYGPEEYLRQYYLNIISKDIINEHSQLFNKIELSGNITKNDLIDICETYPVMSDKKLIIVRDSSFFKTKANTSKKSKGNNDFGDYLKDLPEYVHLIFVEDSVDKRLSLVSKIKKSGKVVEFNYQDIKNLLGWVKNVFKSYDKEINNQLALLLIDYCEPGMNEILNEIKKLVLYIKSRGYITQEDIEKICIKSIKTKVFDLIDTIAEKNSIKALELLDDMINMREHVQKIIVLMAKQFINMLKVKQLVNCGQSINDVISKMHMNPYVVRKISKQINKFSLEELKKIIEKLAEIDVMIKSGKIKDRIALELFIVSVL